MRKLQLLRCLVFTAVAAVCLTAASAREPPDRPGLLILAHGSPRAAWNESVKQLTEKVTALNETKKTFHAVTAAFLEFAKPDAAAGAATLEKAGCNQIIVVPVFTCPGSHTHFDVPAVLGLYSSPSTREMMKEENLRPAETHVPVTITQTIDEGDLLDRYVRDEIASLSVNPEEEAVLLIAHGDEGHTGLIEPVMRRLLTGVCGSTKIARGNWAFCGVGQTYKQNVVPVIQKLAESKKRVLVVGLYLALSAKSIDSRSAAAGEPQPHSHDHNHSHGGEAHTHAPEKPAAEQKNPLDGLDVRFSERGIITHPEMPDWILQCAAEAL